MFKKIFANRHNTLVTVLVFIIVVGLIVGLSVGLSVENSSSGSQSAIQGSALPSMLAGAVSKEQLSAAINATSSCDVLIALRIFAMQLNDTENTAKADNKLIMLGCISSGDSMATGGMTTQQLAKF
jgi:hypothetical protein